MFEPPRIESKWSMYHADCIPHMTEKMEPKSVDMCVCSPPFPALYCYSSHEADMGNTDTVEAESRIHFSYFYKALARVMKPGRVVCIHLCQIPRMKRNGGTGLCDFRGINIRIAERAGLVYEYDWLISKDPQLQALRTKSRELQFNGLESDRARSRGALGDYIIKFRAPGENQVRINSKNEVSRNEWIDWAEASWTGIRLTDTLQVRGTKSEDDVKHVCPLQKPVIDRCIKLYSNPGELVLSPFAGIGSEGYVSLKNNRKFYGIELKKEYFKQACKNLNSVTNTSQKTMFETGIEDESELELV